MAFLKSLYKMNKGNSGKKKIALYAVGEPYGGGSWQYASFLLDALYSVADRYDVIIVCLEKKNQWIELAKKYGFAFQYFRYRGLYPFYLHKLLDNQGYDLIIDSVQNETCIYVETPVLSIVHDIMHRYESFPEIASEFKSREAKYKGIAKYAKAVFVDSDMGKQQFIDCYGCSSKDRLYVMPFRVPDYLMKNDNIVIDRKRSYIFYPAQFWTHKNHEILIKAAYKLKQDDGVFVKLLFVGAPKNNYESILGIIETLNMKDQVEVKGYVDDDEMRGLYDNARAMMMPSFCGPTNIPPIEAMYTGCPCAVAKVYGMPWQVDNAGLTFDPSSVNDTADVMRRLWIDDDLCRKLSQKGKERSEIFSKDSFNNRFADAIDSITGSLNSNNYVRKTAVTKFGLKIIRCFNAHILRR